MRVLPQLVWYVQKIVLDVSGEMITMKSII